MADSLLPSNYLSGHFQLESEDDIDPVLLAEFQREIERHEQVV